MAIGNGDAGDRAFYLAKKKMMEEYRSQRNGLLTQSRLFAVDFATRVSVRSIRGNNSSNESSDNLASAFNKEENKIIKNAKLKILKIYKDMHELGHSKEPPFSIGFIEPRMYNFANANGITLNGIDMFMSYNSLAHARRPSKLRDGSAVPIREIMRFPHARKKMKLYYNTEDKSFVYTNGKYKFVINPSYKIKINGNYEFLPNFLTAYKLNDANEFNMHKYQMI